MLQEDKKEGEEDTAAGESGAGGGEERAEGGEAGDEPAPKPLNIQLDDETVGMGQYGDKTNVAALGEIHSMNGHVRCTKV